jgi:hypothetical protein
MSDAPEVERREVPEPEYDADEAPLTDGEAVAMPTPVGAPLTLRFPSPYEVYLVLDGRRVVEDDGGPSRELLLWSSRRLPSLWRALEDRAAVRGVLLDGRVIVTDLYDFSSGQFVDHGLLRERLEPAAVELGRFSLLGPIGTRAELVSRVRAIYAPGTVVEVRIEDGRRVISRRRLRVGR